MHGHMNVTYNIVWQLYSPYKNTFNEMHRIFPAYDSYVAVKYDLSL